jgi:four helix bundle protein
LERKNINRGYKQLRVWNDAIELYVLTCKILSGFPFELKKTAGNCIDASHSISRNIAEGYSRRSVKEYVHFLYIALGSSGEFHSSICSFLAASQITTMEFYQLDELHYKTENELIQLIKSVQKKAKTGEWEDTLE